MIKGFEIFVLACQIASGGGGAVCREDILATREKEPMQLEMIQLFAAWAAQHEGWAVERWGSRRTGRGFVKA